MSRMKLQPRSLTPPFMSTIARDVDQLQNRVRRMFENPFAAATDPFPFVQPIGWAPPVDIAESDNELVMTVELPGLDRNDVKLSIDGDLITLTGEKREEHIEGGKDTDYYLEERSYGSFARSFTLPPNVDGSKAAATFEKGILTLRMPKNAQPQSRGREIEITSK